MEYLGNYREFLPENEADIQRDVLGRYRREYYPRVHPFEWYREAKFVSRYRLSKNIAAALADEFGRSEFATSGRSAGGGLSHRDRVNIICKY